ncbi:FadR/GntR family transcriptional regulator [uncultured Cohaesibacter sp.]|uniref:FadR/GntR family transcriptional regulator n=1 Tax=uncultured Cohaesibacter sp. TaxID=1002546 RepID=UPI0029C844CF|nr:FadR/GntR family transcriptional regulator [uncultured Cohaesibacter sp.]
MEAGLSETRQNNGKAQTLVSQISDHLRREIATAKYVPGDRLPSEAELGRRFEVSRTVVREAIAILRSDGLVEARKGAGVFILDPREARQKHPFADLSSDRISEVIELLEMRSAFEIRSASLAAARRSSAQLENILKAHAVVGEAMVAEEWPYEADFQFHYEIAVATQNKRFPQFLAMIRPGIIPRKDLSVGNDRRKIHPNPHLHREHAIILQAIVDGDSEAAEAAMKTHLEGALSRYRNMLRESLTSDISA